MKKILLTTLFLLFANSIFSQTSIYPKEEGTVFLMKMDTPTKQTD